MLSGFAVVLVFSTMMPVILVWGLMFLGVRYLCDRYNLTRVHQRDVISHGEIRYTLVSILYQCLCLYQLAMASFFSIKKRMTLLTICACAFLFSLYLLVLHWREAAKRERRSSQLQHPDADTDTETMSSVTSSSTAVVSPELEVELKAAFKRDYCRPMRHAKLRDPNTFDDRPTPNSVGGLNTSAASSNGIYEML
eukprot:GFYU01006625.1.p1 GENE.GFYU01006625.1~~GFYU01006625.1.p1  ORF type:complete len:195 (-),score=61.27 GFYU01006625.1:299-883(-)